MGKKGVPEWLNSSLWSSSNPSSLHNDRYHIKPETVAPDPLPPPPPPPPPPRPQTLPKEEKRPSRAGTLESDDPPAYDNDPSSLSASSPDEISRQAQLLAELSKKVINAKELRRLASQGIPDGAGIRSTVWKILLGYLPNDRGLWAAELAKKRSQYTLFKEELLVNPSEIARRLDKSTGIGNDESNCEGSGLLPRSEITHGEHPLSLGKTSVWNQFFQDTEIIEQIDRDVKRTHPDMNFFSGDSSFAKSNQEALRHILIVFAKLNPGIRYVQGMNEVLAPLFYVFRNDPDEENAVNPQFYAFRWITLLLTQEFNFADSLHIWDTLLSDPEGPQETLLRVCCAMLILIRRRLLAGDFTSNLKLLQNYPSSTNISHLLYVADKLRVPASS
ncbi:uncharacterized protein LOC131246844 isoform X3 [Magnolia sinica]|uniref:uncharacterized protein LOC131246844 isoform X3 n=1 Tax=Magnolia sinica TaxID=86752 RepID=UPI002657EDCA|nr:uncharacterized protein LOC131246844 isoform X3 [Magnolia sinica]